MKITNVLDLPGMKVNNYCQKNYRFARWSSISFFLTRENLNCNNNVQDTYEVFSERRSNDVSTYTNHPHRDEKLVFCHDFLPCFSTMSSMYFCRSECCGRQCFKHFHPWIKFTNRSGKRNNFVSSLQMQRIKYKWFPFNIMIIVSQTFSSCYKKASCTYCLLLLHEYCNSFHNFKLIAPKMVLGR